MELATASLERLEGLGRELAAVVTVTGRGRAGRGRAGRRRARPGPRPRAAPRHPLRGQGHPGDGRHPDHLGRRAVPRPGAGARRDRRAAAARRRRGARGEARHRRDRRRHGLRQPRRLLHRPDGQPLEPRRLGLRLVERPGGGGGAAASCRSRSARTPAARSSSPAAWTGLAGLRATYGRVSRARRDDAVLDARPARADVPHGRRLRPRARGDRGRRPAPTPAASTPPYRHDLARFARGGFRFAVARGGADGAEPEIADALRPLAGAACASSARSRRSPSPTCRTLSIVEMLIGAESAAAFDDFIAAGRTRELTAPKAAGHRLDGLVLPAVDYIRAQRVRRKVARPSTRSPLATTPSSPRASAPRPRACTRASSTCSRARSRSRSTRRRGVGHADDLDPERPRPERAAERPAARGRPARRARDPRRGTALETRLGFTALRPPAPIGPAVEAAR